MRCKCCNEPNARPYRGGDWYCGSCVPIIKQTLEEMRLSSKLPHTKYKAEEDGS